MAARGESMNPVERLGTCSRAEFPAAVSAVRELVAEHPPASDDEAAVLRVDIASAFIRRGFPRADAQQRAGRMVPLPTEATADDQDDPEWLAAFSGLDDADAAPDEQPALARMLAWPGRLTAVHGPAGSGKTRALGAAAAAVSNGARWLEQDTIAGRVLWIAFEDEGGSTAILRKHGASAERVVVGPGGALMHDGEWAERLPVLVAMADPTWIIVDSFAALCAAASCDSNNADEVTRLLAPLSALAADGRAVSVTHHEPHTEARLRNSTGISAAVDAVVRVTHSGRVTTFAAGAKLRYGLQHDQRVAGRLSDGGTEFHLVTSRGTETDQVQLVDRVESDVRAFLAKHPEGVSLRAAGREVSGRAERIRAAVRAVGREGTDRRWRLAGEGASQEGDLYPQDAPDAPRPESASGPMGRGADAPGRSASQSASGPIGDAPLGTHPGTHPKARPRAERRTHLLAAGVNCDCCGAPCSPAFGRCRACVESGMRRADVA